MEEEENSDDEKKEDVDKQSDSDNLKERIEECVAKLLQMEMEETNARLIAEDEATKVFLERIRQEESEEEKRRLIEELKQQAIQKRKEAEEGQRQKEREIAKLDEAARKKEAKRQQYLRSMGTCCMNFDWIHLGDGQYRCAGGSHHCRIPPHYME